MIDYLRDPIWQFVGALLTLATIAAAVLIFRAQRNKKSLSYKVISDTKLLTVDEEIAGEVEIVYGGTPVKNVNLCLLKIVNDGNVPVASADYERPLSFRFGDTCQILSAKIVNQSPQNLQPQSRYDATRFYLEPLLLNRKDSLTVKLLIAQYDSIVEPDARIIGIREVQKVKDRSRLTSSILILALSIVAVVVVIRAFNASSFWGLGPEFDAAVSLVALGLGLLAGYLQFWRRRDSDS